MTSLRSHKKFGAYALVATSLMATAAFAEGIETRSLDELYAAALAEGGQFVLRTGGDEPTQIDCYLDQFEARFPDLNVIYSVDVSLNHAPRFDNARAAEDLERIPDVIQFQTLHDFNYDTEQGLLQPYRPANWDLVIPDPRDPHGHWAGCTG